MSSSKISQSSSSAAAAADVSTRMATATRTPVHIEDRNESASSKDDPVGPSETASSEDQQANLPKSDNDDNKPNIPAIASGAALGAAALFLAIFGLTCWMRRRKPHEAQSDAPLSWLLSQSRQTYTTSQGSTRISPDMQTRSGLGSVQSLPRQPLHTPATDGSSGASRGAIEDWTKEQSHFQRSEEIVDDTESRVPISPTTDFDDGRVTRSEWEAPLDSRSALGVRSMVAPTAVESDFVARRSARMGESRPW